MLSMENCLASEVGKSCRVLQHEYNLNTFRCTEEVLKIQIVYASPYMSYLKSLVQRSRIQRSYWALEVRESKLLMNAFTR